jgi:hypothetical protein
VRRGWRYLQAGFYGISFLMALFGAVAVQKNTRDMEAAKRHEPVYETPVESYENTQ